MKPSELFPGAVVIDQDGNPFVIESIGIGVVSSAKEESVKIELLTPLPLSPAVLRGFGFEFNDEFDAYVYAELEVYSDELFWRISGELDPIIIESAHQLQALALHLYGVEFTWNQSEYETALKEEAK